MGKIGNLDFYIKWEKRGCLRDSEVSNRDESRMENKECDDEIFPMSKIRRKLIFFGKYPISPKSLLDPLLRLIAFVIERNFANIFLMTKETR